MVTEVNSDNVLVADNDKWYTMVETLQDKKEATEHNRPILYQHEINKRDYITSLMFSQTYVLIKNAE